jgi:hypothetical protein
MVGISIWQVFTSIGEITALLVYVAATSFLVGLIEVPLLCTCLSESKSKGREKK